MEQIPTFLDFEASSLRSTSYPIEVAWNDPTGAIEAHLISPAGIERWTDWSIEAEQLHGISRATLLTGGKPPSWICRRMNHQLAGTVVYSDDPEYDQMWLATLFAVSSCGGPAFTVHHKCRDYGDRTPSHTRSHRRPEGALWHRPHGAPVPTPRRGYGRGIRFLIALDPIVYAPLRELCPVPPPQILLWPLNDPYLEGLDAYRQCLAQLQVSIEAHTPQFLEYERSRPTESPAGETPVAPSDAHGTHISCRPVAIRSGCRGRVGEMDVP